MGKADLITKQFLILPAPGKRLIAKSLLLLPSIKKAIKNHTIVIIAGTTNGYVAEEILRELNQLSDFSKKRFFRRITLPPTYKKTKIGGNVDDIKFIGDVVIVNGKWEKGKTIFDAVDSLQKEDIIIKGANALDINNNQAAIFIEHFKAGTINAALQAVLGRRVQLILPVGLEKRIVGDLNYLANKLNATNASGLRLFPVNGRIITEIEAINLLTGTFAEIVAGGGICGAEGSYWLAVTGSAEQLEKVEKLVKEISKEPAFEL